MISLFLTFTYRDWLEDMEFISFFWLRVFLFHNVSHPPLNYFSFFYIVVVTAIKTTVITLSRVKKVLRPANIYNHSSVLYECLNPYIYKNNINKWFSKYNRMGILSCFIFSIFLEIRNY